MKKVLHITNHIGTIKNISNVFKYLNISDSLETIFDKDYFPLYISFEHANFIWNMKYKEIIIEKKTSHLIFTDTSMYARPFLQNINDHELIIIIYRTALNTL